MQKAGVIRVLIVLLIQLPISGQTLALIAEHLQLAPVERTVEQAENRRPEIFLDRLIRCPNLANTTPCREVVASCVRPLASGRKSAGMPPWPRNPRRNGTPRSLPVRS